MTEKNQNLYTPELLQTKNEKFIYQHFCSRVTPSLFHTYSKEIYVVTNPMEQENLHQVLKIPPQKRLTGIILFNRQLHQRLVNTIKR